MKKILRNKKDRVDNSHLASTGIEYKIYDWKKGEKRHEQTSKIHERISKYG